MHHKTDRRIVRAHLEAGLDECRWCFAVDLARIKGTLIARYEFPDGCLEYHSCSKCGGEFSVYVPVWCKEYVKERINELHPELEGKIDDRLFTEVNSRVLFPDNLGDYLRD